MVELDKIKSDIRDICASMETAYRNLCDKGDKREKEDQVIKELKDEILLLEQRKSNVHQQVRDEQSAAGEKKKEYTAKKVKYRKLIDQEEKTLSVYRDKVQKEVDNLRTREMSQFRAEKDKIISEITMGKAELAEVRKDYGNYKSMLIKLKEGINV